MKVLKQYFSTQVLCHLITTSNLLIGIGLAIVALIILGFAMMKASGKLPISKVFLVLSWLIYILGFKMLGVSIHALQNY